MFVPKHGDLGRTNREERLLHHVAMVAKFSDDKSLESLFALYLKLHRSYSISFNLKILAKFSLGLYLSLSNFRKRKRQFLCCVHLHVLHKVGS